MTVFLQSATGEPSSLIQSLDAAPDAARGIHFVSALLPGVNRTDPAAWHPEARLTTLFLQDPVRRSHDAGRVRFLPLSYAGFDRYLSSQRFDLALIQVTPPDEAGRCSLGASVHFAPTAIRRSRKVVAEINHAAPRPKDSVTLPLSRLDFRCQAGHPLPGLEVGGITPVIERIAANAATLIRDGDVLQIGIGKIPAKILQALGDRRDLGLHGGLVTDEVRWLHEAGVITGRSKRIDRGKLVCTAVIGSQALYDWADQAADLRLRPVAYTHDLRRLARLDRLVAINGALAVDLLGQANAEMIDGRQVSGVGGLADFSRAARLSKDGRSILVLPATAAGGRHSRIVPRLGRRDVVSVARADADLVVTEHGVASLAGKSADERAEALIAIADPAFRAELEDAWKGSRHGP
jgi:4-hydroxybutyrate CoA-transferase